MVNIQLINENIIYLNKENIVLEAVNKNLEIQNSYFNRIITMYDDNSHSLDIKAEDISLDDAGRHDAQIFYEIMLSLLKPLMPAAGLAAPQIGYSKRMFIWSWDRTLENMEMVINPIVLHKAEQCTMSWEACLSALQEHHECQIAHIQRAEYLDVAYYALKDGRFCHVKKRITGFGARVFQHEYDHLEGILCVTKPCAHTKIFPNRNAVKEFMKTIKHQDSLSYIKPIDIDKSSLDSYLSSIF